MKETRKDIIPSTLRIENSWVSVSGLDFRTDGKVCINWDVWLQRRRLIGDWVYQ